MNTTPATSSTMTTPPPATSPTPPLVVVRQVWADNLAYEFFLIHMAICQHPFVSIDTEYPGMIFQSTYDHRSYAPPPYNYYLMKINVDVLKIVQLGLTLSDSDGNLPRFGSNSCYAWQFNFRDFDINRDPHNLNSTSLLERHGIDFQKNKRDGIDSLEFAILARRSGLVSNRNLTWITFHGAYDLSFLIKIVTQRSLPSEIQSFMDLVSQYLGDKVYDMKVVVECVSGFHGGLEMVAKFLGVDRAVRVRHENSLFTMEMCMKFMKKTHATMGVDLVEFAGKIFGLCEFTSKAEYGFEDIRLKLKSLKQPKHGFQDLCLKLKI